MAGDKSAVKVSILGDSTSLQRAGRQAQASLDGLGKTASGASGKARGAFLGMGTAAKAGLAGLVGGSAIVGGKAIFDMAAKMELMDAKGKTVFGNQIGVVEKWAKANAAGMGLTSKEAVGLSANFADLLIPMGFTRSAAAKMSTDVVGLSGALSQWSGGTKSAAEVSEILAAAMLGETDGLKALGIAIGAADIDAQLLKNGKDKLTGAALAQAKAEATQQLVMEKSTDAQAAYAKSSQTLAGKKAQLTARMKELRDKAISGLVPVLLKMGGFLASTLGPAFSTVSMSVSAMSAAFKDGDVTSDGLVGVFEKIGVFARTLKFSISALFAAFKDGDVTSDGTVGAFERIGVALRNVNAKLQPVFRFIRDHAKPILIGLAVGLAFLVAPFTMTATALVVLYAKFAFFRAGVAAVATFITDTVVPAVQRMAAFFMATVLPALIKVGSFLVTTFTPTFKALSTYLTGSLIPAVQGLAQRVMENKPQLLALGKAVGIVAAVVAFLAAKILGFLLPVIIKLQGFVVGSLFAALGKLIGIIGGVIRFVGALGAGFAIATMKIKTAVTGAATWVSAKFTSIVATVKAMPGKISSAASGMFDGIKAAFRGAINFIIRAWNGLEFGIPGFDPPGPGPTFPGFTLGVPDIPQLAQGGIVKARRGGMLANIGEGRHDEAVIPLDGKNRGGGGVTLIVNGVIDDAMVRKLETMLTRVQRDRGTKLAFL